jgi:hypothetical protein
MSARARAQRVVRFLVHLDDLSRVNRESIESQSRVNRESIESQSRVYQE